MKRILLLLLFLSFSVFSQVNFVPLLSENLKENANLILEESIEISIPTIEYYTVKTQKKAWILNKLGLKDFGAYELYGGNESILNLEAVIYDSKGKEIKKFKKRDFSDESVSGTNFITDNRVLVLNYTPVSYPFYIVFESETKSSNTAFIPIWYPQSDYFCSVFNSTLKITWGGGVPFKYKEFSNSLFNFESIRTKNELVFTANNLTAIKNEPLTPPLLTFVPKVMFGLNEFYLEGVKGSANSWEEFGNWINNSLLQNTTELSETTQQELQKLVEGKTDVLEKAKIVYEYMQNKTRYVSIQLGIGGWKPMLAKDVDRLGYGDCKALTNYTRALLEAVDVPSQYTVVYAGQKRDLEEDFVSMQGNHVILGIPYQNEVAWLECTSQHMPFNYQGSFTNDRKVLSVSENNSKIIRTKKFAEGENIIEHKSKVFINANGDLAGEIKIVSSGLEYDERSFLELYDEKDLVDFYKENYTIIPSITVEKHSLLNNKTEVSFLEEINFSTKGFINFRGNQEIVPLNMIYQYNSVPNRVRDRKLPFEIENGYVAQDDVEINLEDNLAIDAIPSNEKLESEFGSYKVTIENKENKVVYSRTFKLKSGIYPPEKYEDYRKFREQIAKLENSKFVVKKI